MRNRGKGDYAILAAVFVDFCERGGKRGGVTTLRRQFVFAFHLGGGERESGHQSV